MIFDEKKIRILSPGAIAAGWMPGEPRPKRETGLSYEEFKDPDTEVVYRDQPDAMGPHVEQSFERDLAAIPYARAAYEADQEGSFDAVMIGCFEEPGMQAARELCDILVMSAPCATLHVASMLGNKFSIIFCGRGHSEATMLEVVKRYGLESRLASIRTLGFPPTGFNKKLLSEEEFQKMNEVALAEAKKAIEEDGADVIIAYSGSYDYLKKHLDVPVLSQSICTLKITEALVRMGLTHSKKAYPKPRIAHTYYITTKPPCE